MTYEVVDVESTGRYELLDDGQLLGYATYDESVADPAADPSAGDTLGPTAVRDIHHTFIDPDKRGRGLGKVMMAGVLGHVRAAGMHVVPTCPFVRAYFDQHPDEQDLLA